MIFHETALKGVWLLEPEQITDERGFFVRTYSETEFREHGIEFNMVQANLSFNHRRGTLRGMHYQAEPYGEGKLIRCVAGALYDVAVDIDPASPTFKQWVGVELAAENRMSFYIPPGMAHGFQTLTDATEIMYQMSAFYHPEAARGVRYSDPAFNISWPLPVSIIAARDQNYPDFTL